MKALKHVKVIASLLAVMMLLSGCSLGFFKAADELIDPISPTGESASLRNALDIYCKDGYSLKTPLNCEYKTSFINYDLDFDNDDEFIVFYQPFSAPDRTDLAIIDNVGGNYNVVFNLEGEGKNVYSVEFVNLNDDDFAELVILWDTDSNPVKHMLSVYKQVNDNGGISFIKSGKSLSASDYISVDINNAGVNELLIFNTESKNSARATLYTLKNVGLRSRSSTKVDGHIDSYKKIISENTDMGFCVFADAVKSDGSQMLTELIIWSDYYDEIIAPYYSYSSGETKNTSRNSQLCSMDVNADGYIEIPIDASGISVPERVEAIDWKQYRNSVLKHVCYTLAVEKDGYQVLIPAEYFNQITVTYSDESSELTVSDKENNLIFSIMFLPKAVYHENPESYSSYTEISSDSVYIYLAECGNDSDIKITLENLKSMIKSYEGEVR